MSDGELTKVEATKPTFKVWLRSVAYGVGNFFIRYPFAILATVFLVVGGVALAAFGQKVQIGGLLSKLRGSKAEEGDDVPVVTAPPTRVDDTGKIIQPGVSDDKGYVQVPVVLPIKDPGLLSNPNTVVVTTPEGKDISIPLPTGVKNKDVKEVILVSPNVYQISNNDTGVDAGSILEDLNQ